MPYAHTKDGAPSAEWQLLGEHLTAVAACARAFAEVWGAGEIALLAGLWHDVGKYAPAWQDFLHRAGSEAPVLGEDSDEDGRAVATARLRGPDHSTAGAIHAQGALGQQDMVGAVVSFVVAAHHAGLSNSQDLRSRLRDPDKRLLYEAAVAETPADILRPQVVPRLPGVLRSAPASTAESDAARRQLEAFVRMIFSCLVDADFLDTEAFHDSGSRAASRSVTRTAWPPLAEYRPALDAHLETLDASSRTSINVARRRVLDWCRAAADGPRGVYSLTVPTGGGKTLSSLAFALRHAVAHRLDRVVVALPFLSILDQTVDVFRQVFESTLGPRFLVEHHSAIDPRRDTIANRLASENWDAPLIVTTQVQLFESLFACRTSTCRKLHNLANSVIILDEVQTLPVELLRPILDQLQELNRAYGATLLLTTATQPSLHSRQLGPTRFDGFDPAPTEVVPREEMAGLFDTLQRVHVEWPVGEGTVEWAGLAQQIVENAQVLAIVHKRQDAKDLWGACRDISRGTLFHLSALMCPAHRREVFGEMRRRLAAGAPCRVVSTQLVEAGVDVDFPVVFRAMAGLESLAQSAGRCNREGLLPGPGRFVVFRAPTEPPGLLKQHREIAEIMLRIEPDLDLTQPDTFRRYFDQLYAGRSLDARGIQTLREQFKFRDVATHFKMIDDGAETVYVGYGEAGRHAIRQLRHGGPSRDAFRALQALGVSVFPPAMSKLRHEGAVELLHDSVWVLISDAHYSADFGLVVESDPGAVFIS